MRFTKGKLVKAGEQPVSDSLGYQPGDSIDCTYAISLGEYEEYNRIYLGNDRWYKDTNPTDIVIAALYEGELIFNAQDDIFP